MITLPALLALGSTVISIQIALLAAHTLHISSWRYIIDLISWTINIYLSWRYRITSIRGSRPIPTCPYRWPNGQGDVAKFLEGEINSESWGEEHGCVYRIWNGTTPEIVVTKAEDVRAIFYDSDKHTKAVNNNAGWLMGELLGKCVGLISGSDWRRVRRGTAQHFNFGNTSTYLSTIQKTTKDYLQNLQSRQNPHNDRIDPVNDLRLLPFWTVATIVYGSLDFNMKEELQYIITLREALWSEMIQGGLTRFAWSQYLPTETSRKLQEFKKRWHNFNLIFLERRKSGHEVTPGSQMFAEVMQGTMSLDQLLQTLDEILFANLDVTMGGISWNLLFLAANPDVQAEIRKEYFASVGTGDANIRNRYLLDSDTLLAASIMESARLRPLAAFTVPQSAPTARSVGGFAVPAGTNFVVDTYKLNTCQKYWGNDSQEYRPKRFLNTRRSEMRYNYWRYGFGARQCMGKYLADVMIRVLLAQILETHELGLADDSCWKKNPESWISQPNTEVFWRSLRTQDGK